jgi:3-oxoacyl-[acyl-carrier protein] reductase
MDAGVTLGLTGRRALVTGGSRGVGRATALMLARAGAEVGISYRTRQADAESVVAEIGAIGRRGWAQAAELAGEADVQALFARCDAEFGGLDLFVGNAGIWPPDEVPLAEMDDTRWARTMEANLTSIFRTVRVAARVLAPGGRIVLVASTAAQRGEAFHADYAASKGAMISLVKSLAVELAPRDVTVNCVAPGWIDTEMVADAVAAEGRARIESTIPLGRIASPGDVAGPIVFLCSALSRHITGEVLNVNGGSVLCG